MSEKAKITWVNHASYILEFQDVKLISDPWISGRVFNESWSLISPSVFTFEDYKEITHIWFSHEHPDHFFPPNIKSIPPEYRKNISVLFQKTMDRKVIEFCKRLEFKEIIELSPLKTYHISNNLNIINNKVSNDTDSWLIVKAGDSTFVNINDCVFKSAKELEVVKSMAGEEIDVLFTQFSFANWVGNANDKESKLRSAKNKLAEMKKLIEVFKPRYTIPFASYVYFCHVDNFHMNAQANKISTVKTLISDNASIPLVLYPGEEWVVGEEHDSVKSINRYENDIANIKNSDLTHSPKVDFEDLMKSSESNRQRCLELNDQTKLLSYKPLKIYLTDYMMAYEYSFKNGLCDANKMKEDDCDVAMRSQSFKYCLDFDWGYDTIHVAGTFEKPAGGDFNNFLEYQWIGNLNNNGRRMPGLFKRILKRIFK